MLFLRSLLSVILFVSSVSTIQAGVDKTQAQIAAQLNGWEGDSTGESPGYYVDNADKVQKWTTRSYLADSEPNPALQHNKTVGGDFIPHRHHQAEFGSAGAPTADQSDLYWDKRFTAATREDKNNNKSKKQHQTCYEWALANTPHGNGGIYDYQFGGANENATSAAMQSAFLAAMEPRADKHNVAANDLLLYEENEEAGQLAHATLVVEVRDAGANKKEPSKLKWKWMSSAIYTYTTPNDNAHEFETPYCFGAEKLNTALKDQGWKAGFINIVHVFGPKPP
jgi:hypothetical protein